MAIARSIMNHVFILCVVGALSCAAKEVSKETDAFLTGTFGVGYDVLSKIPESDRPDLFRREDEVVDDTDGFPSWYDYIGLLEQAAETYGFSCDNNCTDDIYWDPDQHGCTTNGETVDNSYCTNLGTYFDCKLGEHAYSDSADAWGIESIGTCDCPSGCMGDRGVCESGRCSCKCGYSGYDCSQIDCRKQHCNDRGTCRFMEDLDANTCVCEAGYAGDDCSIDMTAPLPPIPALFPGSQYSSKDKYGDDHPIFNMSTIGQFHVQMSEEDLRFFLTPINQQTDDYAKVNVSFYNGVESKFLEGVGMRIKGGSSRSYAKKSWKISVNSFDNKGDTWKQQKKIALKSASMTPDYIREVAAATALHAMGSPVQRMSYATLTINGMSQGLHLVMEEPGRDEFVKSRFGSDKGRLYKCLGTFDYLGEDPELYREQKCFWQGFPCYGPQNDVAEEKSFEPLAKLMKILNISNDREFEREIHTIFDVEFFLRNLVAEVMTGNWDGIWNSNNYFLYYNTDGIFYYFRYDLDLSFGMTNYLFRTDKKNIWDYGFDGRGKILIERILAIPSFRDIYSDYMNKMMGYVNADPNGPFLERLKAIRTRIAPLVKLDYWHRVDKAYSYEEFETSLEEPVIRPNTLPDNHFLKPEYILARSIIDFLERRVAATTEQLAEGPPCID